MPSGRPLHAVAVLAALLPFVSRGVRAQSAPLTLEDCIRLALASPSAVDVARGQRRMAELGITGARAALLPQLKVDGAFTYNSPLEGTSDVPSHVALNGIREYGALVTAVQELDTSGRLRAASARARANRDAAEAGVRIAERDLKRAVTGAYYRLLLARRLAQVARDALDEAQRFEGRTRQLFEKGESARGDLVKASAQAAFLEQAVSAADLAAEIADHDLASYWNASAAEALSVADVLETAPLPPEAALEAPGENPFLRRPEWARMEAERAGFLADARRAHGDRLPQAAFTFQYGLDALRFDWDDRGYAAFFNLTVPVFDWSRAKSASRQLELQADQVDLERRIAERTFSREYRDAVARVRAAYAQIDLTRRQVSLSEENLRISRIRYEGGEGSALDVVTAQSDLANARTNYFTALARHLEARADLAVAAGQ
jgi:outer membrane protein